MSYLGFSPYNQSRQGAVVSNPVSFSTDLFGPQEKDRIH